VIRTIQNREDKVEDRRAGDKCLHSSQEDVEQRAWCIAAAAKGCAHSRDTCTV